MADNCLPIHVDIVKKVRYDVGYQITGGFQNAGFPFQVKEGWLSGPVQ
jgi:hypothetical protein